MRLEDNYLEIEAGDLLGELEIVATPNCAVLPAGTKCATHDGALRKRLWPPRGGAWLCVGSRRFCWRSGNGTDATRSCFRACFLVFVCTGRSERSASSSHVSVGIRV